MGVVGTFAVALDFLAEISLLTFQGLTGGRGAGTKVMSLDTSGVLLPALDDFLSSRLEAWDCFSQAAVLSSDIDEIEATKSSSFSNVGVDAGPMLEDETAGEMAVELVSPFVLECESAMVVVRNCGVDVLVVGAVLPFMLGAAVDEAEEAGLCAGDGPVEEGVLGLDEPLVCGLFGVAEFFPDAAAA